MTQEEIVYELFSKEIVKYGRGSIVYGTYEKGVSDMDFLSIVDNSCHPLLDEFPKHEYQYKHEPTSLFRMSTEDYFKPLDTLEFSFMCEDDFLKMIENNDIAALECIFAYKAWGGAYEKYYEAFKLDKWKLRQSVSAICSNSWVKAKKKLTVEKDYNLRVAQKSLWHSMRLYMFAIQIAQDGEIYNFTVANDLWEEIKNAETPTWEYYKEKYQAKFNELRSDLVKLCDRPKEE